MDIEFNLMTESVDHAGPIEPVYVEPGTPLRDVLLVLRERKRHSALICRDGKLAGVFTERDALRVMARGIDLNAPIEEVMTPQPVTVRSSDPYRAGRAEDGHRRISPLADRRRCWSARRTFERGRDRPLLGATFSESDLQPPTCAASCNAAARRPLITPSTETRLLVPLVRAPRHSLTATDTYGSLI